MLKRMQWVAGLLERDADTDLTPLHERDRAIYARLPRPGAAPHDQILQWAALRDPEGAALQGGDDSAAPGLVLGLLGMLLGVLACAGALYFEGGGRVNVVALLGLLLGLQLLSLVITLIGMLPAGARRRIPGLKSLGESVALLSPARTVMAMLHRYFPRAATAVGPLAGAAISELRLFDRVRRWTLWRLSQGFAVAFNLGVLVCFIAMVVFTDLAFGWSTTLEVDPSTIHGLGEAAATPWSRLFPTAVPSMELVETSRFFRAQGAVDVDAALLGQWWPFVLAALICYGLLPRLLLWCFASWRCIRVGRWTLLHLPGASELLYRLNTVLVTTHDGVSPDANGTSPQAPQVLSVVPASGSCTLVVWGDFHKADEVLGAEVRASSALDPVEIHHAGGNRSPSQDRNVIDAVAATSRPVALVVKSWEPPLADFTDFVEELRGFCEESRPLVVIPVAHDAGAPPERSDVAVWRGRLALLADPWLSVRSTSAGAGP